MQSLQLNYTKSLMREKAENKDFDSYVIYVKCGDLEHTFFSENVDEDTYFDIASCGKILITTPLAMQAISEGKMGLAHLADYLRVCLLEKYGGLWMDATLFCSDIIPEQYFEMPFFTLKSEKRKSRYLSEFQWTTFCIGGWKGNVWFSFMREAFEKYWSRADYAIDYLFFDALIYIAKENIPAIRNLMDSVPENTPHRDDLQAAMNQDLPASMFYEIVKKDTTIYKLSWREKYNLKTEEGYPTVYQYFLEMDLGESLW